MGSGVASSSLKFETGRFGGPPGNSPAAPQVSVIIPTLNEAENLRKLLPRIDAALQGRTYEVIVVDDNSPDDTQAVCDEAARVMPVQLIVRENPTDGLSGAVLDGMAIARGDVLAVMDADLQHPPEVLPQLIDAVAQDDADFAIGSRYIEGASSDERWGWARRINSWVATWLARPFAGNTRDPMSGFFALRRARYACARNLTPLGYKIGLELMCKTRVKRVREIPIHFGLRHAGQSKLTIREQFRYLEHLSRLYDFSYPRLSPMVKFLVVTALSWFVGLAAFLGSLGRSIDVAASVCIAYAAALSVIAVFFARYVRTQRRFIPRRRPWVDFAFTSLAEWATASLSAVYFVYRMPYAHPLEVMAICFGLGTLVRYILRKEFSHDVRGMTERPVMG